MTPPPRLPVARRLLPVLLGALAACQSGSDAAVPPVVATAGPIAGDPVRGLDVADRNCALCHQVAATGDSPHHQAPPFATLSQRYPLESLGEALAEGIVVGHQDMPQIRLEPRQIADLLSYLQRIQQPAAPAQR